MADQLPSQRPDLLQVNTGDELSRGRYSNSVLVTHTPEEFIIDWLLNSQSGVHLVSRVVVSPTHMKRVIAALSENMNRFESTFGSVRAVEPKDQKFH
jgi:hypothetical protein